MKMFCQDKSSGHNQVGQFQDGTKRMEAYIKAMEKEVKKRRQVIFEFRTYILNCLWLRLVPKTKNVGRRYKILDHQT